MPRKLEIVVSPEQTERLLADLGRAQGLIGLRVQRGVSLQPPGDLVTVEVTNRGKHPLMRVLSSHGVGISSGTSLSTSEPESIVSLSSAHEIVRDTSESSWEEMEHAMNKESAMTINALLVMMVAGALATVGMATDALHIVVAAMVIAPGFQPLVRAAFGVAARSETWKRGLLDVLRGYAALIAGAAATSLLLGAMGMDVLNGKPSYYMPSGTLISYWIQVNPSSVLVAALASGAGAILVAANRSVLTAGVMIGLALVPSAAIVGIAIATAQWDLAGLGLRRWLMEAGLVAAVGLAVLLWKRASVHRRDSAL